MVSFFVFYNEKKNQKDSANFWHRKITLKVRILLFLTFNSKTTKRPKIFYGCFHSFWLSIPKESNDEKLVGGAWHSTLICNKLYNIVKKKYYHFSFEGREKNFGVEHEFTWVFLECDFSENKCLAFIGRTSTRQHHLICVLDRLKSCSRHFLASI